MNIYQLTYSSYPLADVTADQIEDVLKVSRENNSKRSITGCMVYHNKQFIQILEGKKPIVKKLFQTILRDNRHNKVHLIWKGSNEERSFTAWDMAYYSSEMNGGNSSERKSFENNL
ncbi:BLUF domain-containing protein, partial [Maribacter sp.]|nr:BLUF domain-containing protein [Maribacter sp.]